MVYIDRMIHASRLTFSGSMIDAMYDRRAKDTASAVAYSTSLATLKATWKMMRERKAIAARLSSVDGRAQKALPKAKGVRRYRAMATIGREAQAMPTAQKRVAPTIVSDVDTHLRGIQVHNAQIWATGSTQEAQFKEHVKERCLGRHDLSEFGPDTVTGVPVHNQDLPVCGSTVICVQVDQHTHADVVGYDSQGTTPADVLQPGHRDCPIEIVDSDETTLADSDRTATDSDLTESDDEESFHRVAAKAQGILEAWHIRHAQLDAGTEWDADSVLHLKMPLLEMSRKIDADAARQQVDARFLTE